MPACSVPSWRPGSARERRAAARRPPWQLAYARAAAWDVVRTAAATAGIDKLAPHDLHRTCARVCHLAGGELDQIQFLLGHVSIQTTERSSGVSRSSDAPSTTA
jgi:integrase